MQPPASAFSMTIVTDDCPENPREWDNLGTLTCWHRRYNLGDRHDFPNPNAFRLHLADRKTTGNPDALRHAINRHYVLLPVYMYDHSGLAFSTAPFSCPWDSGWLGYLWVPHQKIRENYGVKRVTGPIRAKAIAALKNELEVYEQYIQGDVYGYQIRNADGNELDSCYGFYGKESCEQAANEAMQCLLLARQVLQDVI